MRALTGDGVYASDVEKIHLRRTRSGLLGLFGPEGPSEIRLTMRNGEVHRYDAGDPAHAEDQLDEMARSVRGAQARRLAKLDGQHDEREKYRVSAPFRKCLWMAGVKMSSSSMASSSNLH